MLLECGCGKMYRVRDGATNPPKNCPACGGPLRQSGGAAAAPAPAAAPAAPPASDSRVKDLEGKVQALEREQGASRAAVELKEKELHEAQSSIARLGADLEKAQGAYKEALLKKDAELAERAAQATKLILSKDEALREAREKIESLEGQTGKSSGVEQELADSRQGKKQLVEELANVESTYKAALKNKEKEVEELQKRAQDLEKQLSAASPKASTPEGQRFQARIASLEKIVQDGEQRYRALQKELDGFQGGDGDSKKRAADNASALAERDNRIRELETRVRELETDVRDFEGRLKEAHDEADQARAKRAGAVSPQAAGGLTSAKLGEVRYLSTDLDRGLASISTALNGLVSRVRRLNETLQEAPEASSNAAETPTSREEEAMADGEPEGVPLVEAPSSEPDVPPELTSEAEDATPVPELETFAAPDEVPASLPTDETLLDMGGVSKPPPEPAPEESEEPAAAEVDEQEPGPPKKGFFGKLFGGKKKPKPLY